MESGSEEEDEDLGAPEDNDLEDETTMGQSSSQRNLRYKQSHNPRRRQNLVER